MENKLVLVGGGGHCLSVLDAALSMKSFCQIVITDPYIKIGTEILGCKVVGTDDKLKMLKDDGFEYAFISVGSIKPSVVRKKLIQMVSNIGFIFATIVDTSAIISDSAVVGEGAFIGKNAIINANAKVGQHTIINTGAIIEHSCEVGDYSHISVGAILCGDVKVGSDCLIGAGSTVIQGIHIGNNTIVGANSTVLSDIKTNSKCYGIVTGRG